MKLAARRTFSDYPFSVHWRSCLSADSRDSNILREGKGVECWCRPGFNVLVVEKAVEREYDNLTEWILKSSYLGLNTGAL